MLVPLPEPVLMLSRPFDRFRYLAVLAGATAVLARFIQILAWFADDFSIGHGRVLAIIFG